MKRSHLAEYIKETIVELLSEEDGTVSTDDPDKAAELAKDGVDVNLTEDDDAEPTKADLAKSKSLAKAKEELAQLIKKMKAKAKNYKEAKGDAKEKIKDELKKMTAEKKSLEKQLDL
jgi:aspartate ammonia-lyase